MSERQKNRKYGVSGTSEGAYSNVLVNPDLPDASLPVPVEGGAKKQTIAVEDQINRDYSEDQINVVLNPFKASYTKGFRTATKSVSLVEKGLQKAEMDPCSEIKNTSESIESQPQSGNVFEPRVTASTDASLIQSLSTDKAPLLSNEKSSSAKENASGGKKCWTACCTAVCGYLKNCRCLKRFVAWFNWYVLSSIVVFGCAVLAVRLDPNDAPLCIIAVIVWCCIVTLSFERGFFTLQLDQKMKAAQSVDGRQVDYIARPNCFCCLCCNAELPVHRNRSQYSRPKEENTDFQCEVVDVNELNADDCPRIRVFEDRDALSQSETCTDRSQVVTAIVHRTDIETEYIYNCEHGCPSACSCPNVVKKKISKAKSTPCILQLKKLNSEGSIVFDEDNGKRESRSCPELNQTKPKDEEVLSSGNASFHSCLFETDNFVCEHTGKGMACNCAETAQSEQTKVGNDGGRVCEFHSGNCDCFETDGDSTPVEKKNSTSPTTDETEYSTDVTESSSSPNDGNVFMCNHYGQGVACNCAQIYAMQQAQRQNVQRPICEFHFPESCDCIAKLGLSRTIKNKGAASFCSNCLQGSSCSCSERSGARSITSFEALNVCRFCASYLDECSCLF